MIIWWINNAIISIFTILIFILIMCDKFSLRLNLFSYKDGELEKKCIFNIKIQQIKIFSLKFRFHIYKFRIMNKCTLPNIIWNVKHDLNHIYRLNLFLIFDIYKILFKSYIIIYPKKSSHKTHCAIIILYSKVKIIYIII